MLTREERVLRVIDGKEVDYLPSQINFSDKTRYDSISKALGLESAAELDHYLENHLYLTMTLQDMPIHYRDVKKDMDEIHEMGFCYPDWENKVVYDSWGIGIQVGVGSFNASFHPLQGRGSEHIEKFMPKNIRAGLIFEKDIDRAVAEYVAPDMEMQGNLSKFKKDIEKYSGEYLLWPSGYCGIYERAYILTGWEEFMTNIALKPNTIMRLLEKITQYKVEFAKKVVSCGFKVAHHGDDLGTQKSTFFSLPMFRKFFLPFLKEVWDVYNDAGIPIMLHSCGNVIDYIPDLIDIGLKVLEPVQPCMDLKYLKKEFGKDLIFFGGIDTQVLPYITPQETRELTKNAIHTLGKGGGLIIAPSQEIMNDVPIENIVAVIETIRQERDKVF